MLALLALPSTTSSAMQSPAAGAPVFLFDMVGGMKKKVRK